MNSYIEKITPLIDNLIVSVGEPNLAYLEAMSNLSETAIANCDNQTPKDDLLFLYEITVASLKQLQTNHPPKTKESFANTLQQLIDILVGAHCMRPSLTE